MFRFQSPDEDCTLEEEEEAPVEEEDDIDQFNDDTFGAGAIDDDWQEEHQRLAGMEVRAVGGAVAGGRAVEIGGAVDPPPASHLPLPSSLPPLHLSHASSGLSPPGLEDGRGGGGGGGGLAESLARFILGADPAIAGLGAAQSPSHPLPGPPGSALDLSRLLPPPSLRPHLHHPPHQLPGGNPPPSGMHPSSMMSYQQQQQMLCRGGGPMGQMASPSIWENSMGFGPVSRSPGLIPHMEDSPLMSIIKEVGLPKQPPPLRGEDPRDLSERVLPPRSSSPVIGSPPVRAVPIGTPPKQPMSLNHQIHHPTAVHVRAPLQHRYPPPFPDRLSPNTLLNLANNPLCRGPFPPGVGPVLSQLQRAQMLNSQVAGFPRGVGPPPMLPGGGGFRPFFGGPPPPHHRMPPPPLHGPPIYHTTHLHPQHRRMLTQRMQSRPLG